MLAEHLDILAQKELKNGFEPFFVNATAGITVIGAFGYIEAISAVCKSTIYGCMLMVLIVEESFLAKNSDA